MRSLRPGPLGLQRAGGVPVRPTNLLGGRSASGVLTSWRLRSTSGASRPTGQPASAEVAKWWAALAARGPAIPLRSLPSDEEAVSILPTPDDFYNQLKEGITRAQKRIVIAALYLGTGHHELELISLLKQACDRNKNLRVSVLFDCARGLRGNPNSAAMFQPLIEAHPGSVSLSLYQTPDLRGFLKRFAPPRWNEIVGVSHYKAFVFDDDTMLSGANLSDQYFTNRQDRYMLFKKAPELADFFETLINKSSEFSFQVTSNGDIKLAPGCPHPEKAPIAEFAEYARSRITPLLKPRLATPTQSADDLASESNTWIFPTVQMGRFGIHHDEHTTEFILSASSAAGAQLDMASAYFNITKRYKDAILSPDHQARVNIITASPKANGFYNSKGMSYYIPMGYTSMEKQFFEEVLRRGQGDRVRIFEYFRKGWTFHAKGLWYTPPGEELPILTMIGSPNFGRRSVDRDLEAQVVVLTQDSVLRRKLAEERAALFGNTELVRRTTFDQKERHVEPWAYLTTGLFSSYF